MTLNRRCRSLGRAVPVPSELGSVDVLSLPGAQPRWVVLRILLPFGQRPTVIREAARFHSLPGTAQSLGHRFSRWVQFSGQVPSKSGQSARQKLLEGHAYFSFLLLMNRQCNVTSRRDLSGQLSACHVRAQEMVRHEGRD